jgi:hypothetical protein
VKGTGSLLIRCRECHLIDASVSVVLSGALKLSAMGVPVLANRASSVAALSQRICVLSAGILGCITVVMRSLRGVWNRSTRHHSGQVTSGQ